MMWLIVVRETGKERREGQGKVKRYK